MSGLINRLLGAPNYTVGDYLHRWYLVPRNRFANAYLHRFSVSDGQDVHDHPWFNVSIILRGRYREHYHDGTYRNRRPGMVVFRGARLLHRLEVLDGPVWTLFLTGPRRRDWGFMTREGWVHFESYTGERGA